MPDGVDTLVHPVQRSVRESVLYRVLPEAELPQLPERDNSMLAISQPRNPPPTWATWAAYVAVDLAQVGHGVIVAPESARLARSSCHACDSRMCLFGKLANGRSGHPPTWVT